MITSPKTLMLALLPLAATQFIQAPPALAGSGGGKGNNHDMQEQQLVELQLMAQIVRQRQLSQATNIVPPPPAPPPPAPPPPSPVKGTF
jgi:hypothetical protein